MRTLVHRSSISLWTLSCSISQVSTSARTLGTSVTQITLQNFLKHAISNVMHSSSQGHVKSSLRSNHPSRDIGDLGSVLRSDCRQRHRQYLESGHQLPSVLVVVWAPVRRRAAISGENGPMSTPRRANQDRRAAPTWRLGSAASCCRFSEHNARLERFTASIPTPKFKSSLGSRR